MVRSQSAGWNDAVNVGMMLELLIPGVQNAEESDLRAQMFWVAGDLKQCLRTGLKQEAVDLAFVLQRQRRKLPRQGEDHVDIAGGQQFFPPRFEPAITCIGLAFWTMPVSARVE